MNYMTLLLTMFILVLVVGKLYQVTACQPVLRAIRVKEANNWDDWMVARFGLHPERKQRILDYIS